jgi:hypothetical protein
MYKPSSRVVIIVAVACAVALGSMVWRWSASSPLEKQTEAHGPTIKAIDARIKEQVAVLRTESLQAGLASLGEASGYVWPGPAGERGSLTGLPLSMRVGQDDIEAILGNRRALKIFQELSALSRKDAGAIVSREIDSTLAAYRDKYEKHWDAIIRESKRVDREPAPVAHPVSAPMGQTTLLGDRYKLLALVLAAGCLGLSDARAAVDDVAAVGEEQYAVALAKNVQGAPAAIAGLSLYNRQILATGVLGANGATLDGDECSVGQIRLAVTREVLNLFDDRATRRDQHGRLGIVRTSPGPGAIAVWFCQPMDDAKYRDVVNAVK